MRLFAAENYDELSRIAAKEIAANVVLKPKCVLGLATGSSPVGLYKQLIKWHQAGQLDFSKVKTVNLDEYVGLSPEHEQSYRYFMQANLFDHINVAAENTNVPNGLAEDLDAECARYNEVIRCMGGIDVQVLGIGHNGHIGFNEPCDCFVPETHTVELTQSTLDANVRFFNSMDEVPRKAITMGIKSIMDAKQILMVANGESKAEALYKAFAGPITPRVPASILQLHPNVVLVGDRAALSRLL